MEEMKVYTSEQWSKDGTFSARPGQFVDDEVFYQLRDCVPPLHLSRDYMQVGEAHGYDFDKGKSTYATFAKEDGRWKFVGNVPSGEGRPKLKDFNDLEFEVHPISKVEQTPTHFQAKMFFWNGYGVSVLLGRLFYSNGKDTYEVAVTKKSGGKELLDCETHVISDVCGYRTRQEVSEIMAKVQRMNPICGQE
jgi:hypothetical protein